MGSPPREALAKPDPSRVPLAVTRYEQTAASLITALILVGGAVLLLFLMWLTSRVWVRPTAIEPQLIEPLAGGGNAMSDVRELADPIDEELVDNEVDLEQTLDSISELVTREQATFADLEQRSTSRGPGTGAGPPGEGNANIIPRWERWELRFPDSSLSPYAQQLDFFGIELAAVGGGRSAIDYASNLSQPQPTRRSATRDNRIHFTWTRDNQLREADLELLRRAGIETSGRLVLKFLPSAIENRMALLEDAAIKQRGLPLERVRRTVFAVVPAEPGYEFQVVEVQSR